MPTDPEPDTASTNTWIGSPPSRQYTQKNDPEKAPTPQPGTLSRNTAARCSSQPSPVPISAGATGTRTHAQADTPAQARKIEKQADRDYKKDPQGISGPKKTPRIQINADKLRAGTEKAREIGGTLVRALTASPKSGTKSRGGYTATNGAMFQLARPNGGNMHYGGNRDAIAPQRPSPVLTKQQLERSRTRSDSAPRR